MTPLPPGPVGPGARRRVTSSLDLLGGHIDQVAVYTLQGVNGSHAVVNAWITQTASQQKLTKTTHMLGDFSLTKFRLAGQRTTEIDLAKALPVSSRSTLSGHATYRLEGSGIATTVAAESVSLDTAVSSAP